MSQLPVAALGVRRALLCAALGWWLGAPLAWAQSQAYDPLAVSAAPAAAVIDLNVTDAARQREIALRVYLPVSTQRAPVLLFSHGLGGSRAGNAYLGRHWAARGYLAVFLQHPGSDESVWRDAAPAARLLAMRRAANLNNTLLRVQDVPAVIDQLTRWQATAGHPLAGRLDLARLGMSGHSFGALTTQAVSGQRDAEGRAVYTDARIKAAVILSPSGPRRGDARLAFGGVTIPWLLMTGSRDVVKLTDIDLASRLSVFPALPPGAKYELVLDRAEHSAFGDRELPGDTAARNPNHHRAVLALSTAFWDAYLRQDAAARSWLDGLGPASVLQTADRWQKK